MRHTKLWLAGQAGNWKLAEYEVEELGEGFDDVVKLHPTHKDSPMDPKDASEDDQRAPRRLSSRDRDAERRGLRGSV